MELCIAEKSWYCTHDKDNIKQTSRTYLIKILTYLFHNSNFVVIELTNICLIVRKFIVFIFCNGRKLLGQTIL